MECVRDLGQEGDGTWDFYVGSGTAYDGLGRRILKAHENYLQGARDHGILADLLDNYLGDVVLADDTIEIHIRVLVSFDISR